MALETYLGEFCAHEDEENQSQELARRLHLLPPVCGPAVSHADRVPLRPPAQQSSPFCVASGWISFFFKKYMCCFIRQQPRGRKICLTESFLCIFSSYREPVSGASLPLRVVAALISRCVGL